MNEKEIEEIRKSADIVDIISSYITLTPKGKNYFGVCPFHDDHSPSMSVSKEKQLYKCFSCGAGGNVFNFVKEYENVNFLEAVNIIAQKIGKSFTYKASKSTINEEEYKTMNLAMVYFQNNLQSLEAKEARKYLEERNIDDEFIKQFHLGFSFQGGKLLEFFNQKKYQPEYLKELGLLNEHDNNYYDVFQNRLIFPILNENGEVVSFIGRVIEKDKTPKYINSKETKIFKKGHILYNYYIAKEKVRLLKKIIIVEGNMDAMRMTMNGFPNTIALMGTSLTKEQIELIKKLHVPVTLMLDNDEAGQKNTYQNGLLLEEANLDINVVRLSKAKDPDEYLVKYGKEAMQEVLNHPISFLEFKLNYLKENKNLQDTKELSNYIKEVLKTLSTSDDIIKDLTLHKIAKEYDLSYDILKNELSKTLAINKPEFVQKEPEKLKKRKYDLLAEAILYYMMNDKEYLKMYQKNLGYFTEKKYRQIASEVLYYYEKHQDINLADFLIYAETSPIKDDIMSIINSIKEAELTNNKMSDYLKMMKLLMYDEDIKKLKIKQKSSSDEVEKNEIANKIIALKKEREKIKKEVN